VVNAIASSYQQTLHPQQLRSLLLAKSEHAPPGVSHRCRHLPAQWPLSRSRPQVLASGDPHGYQGGVLTGRPHPLRGVLLHGRGLWHRDGAGPRRGPCGGHGSGSPERRRCPGGAGGIAGRQEQAAAAVGLDGRPGAVDGQRGRASDPRPAGPRGLRARAPGRLTPRSAAGCAPAAGPARAATSGEQH